MDSRSLATDNNNLPLRGASPDRREEAGLKIYEAVAEGGPASEVNPPARRPPVARITDAGQNAAMDQFGALLDEYLTRESCFQLASVCPFPDLCFEKLRLTRNQSAHTQTICHVAVQDHTTPSHDAEPRLAPSSSRLRDFPPPSTSSSVPRPPSPGHSSEEEEDESDYVYDVYYRAIDVAQKGMSASAATAAGAAAAAGSAASGWDVSSLAGLDRIGQLCVPRLSPWVRFQRLCSMADSQERWKTSNSLDRCRSLAHVGSVSRPCRAGLTEDSDDEAQLLMNEAAAGGSSEEEDNADQDSNGASGNKLVP